MVLLESLVGGFPVICVSYHRFSLFNCQLQTLQVNVVVESLRHHDIVEQSLCLRLAVISLNWWESGFPRLSNHLNKSVHAL